MLTPVVTPIIVGNVITPAFPVEFDSYEDYRAALDAYDAPHPDEPTLDDCLVADNRYL